MIDEHMTVEPSAPSLFILPHPPPSHPNNTMKVNKGSIFK